MFIPRLATLPLLINNLCPKLGTFCTLIEADVGTPSDSFGKLTLC